jgi:hypothetical protein
MYAGDRERESSLYRYVTVGTSWLQTLGISRTSSRRSCTNRLGHGLSLVMTRTSHHENSRNTNANDDKDELSGIVSLPVDRKRSFLVYCTSPTARASIQKPTVASMPVPRPSGVGGSTSRQNDNK